MDNNLDYVNKLIENYKITVPNQDNIKNLYTICTLQNLQPKPMVGPIGPAGPMGPPGEITNFAVFTKQINNQNIDNIQTNIIFDNEIINYGTAIINKDDNIILKKKGIYLIIYELPLNNQQQFGLKINNQLIPYMKATTDEFKMHVIKIGIVKITENNAKLSIVNLLNTKNNFSVSGLDEEDYAICTIIKLK